MRYALLSDVHANLPALTAVLEALRCRGIDRYLCAGDVIGYGPHPAECVETISALDGVWIAGNHELMLLGRIPLERASPLARRTIEWTLGALPSAALKRIEGLPGCAALPEGVVLAHGSLSDATVRVREQAHVRAELARLGREHPGTRVLVLGHTHRAMLADAEKSRPLGLRRTHALELGRSYVLNPGSVGQSRAFSGRARAAVLDTVSGTVEWLAVRYDTRSLKHDLADAGLPTWTHHRSPLRRMVERVERKASRWLTPRGRAESQRRASAAGSPARPRRWRADGSPSDR